MFSSGGVGVDVGQRGVGGFLHHFAELAGELELGRCPSCRWLDEQDVTADGVQARPTATPGMLMSSLDSGK
jgi:hypothetical protein